MPVFHKTRYQPYFRNSHVYYHARHDNLNFDNLNINHILLIIALIFMICISCIFEDTTLYMIPGSTMYIKNTLFQKMLINNIQINNNTNIKVKLLNEEPYFCDINKLKFSDEIILNYKDYLDHPHYLNKDDLITLNISSYAKVYVLSKNEFNIFKNSKNTISSHNCYDNNCEIKIISDGEYHIVIETVNNINTYKIEYTILRNLYCAQNYINIDNNKIIIPVNSKGILISIPTNNFENIWRDIEFSNKIIYNYNLIYIIIFTNLIGGLIYFFIFHQG